MLSFNQIISITTQMSPLIGIGIAVYYRRYNYIGLILLLSLVFDIIIVYQKKHGFDTHPFANIYILTEVIFVPIYLYSQLLKSTLKASIVVLAGFVLLLIHTLIFSPDSYNGLGWAVASFYYIVLVVISFFKLIRSKEIMFIEKQPQFWAYTGILISSSIFFTIYLFMNTMAKEHPRFLSNIWVVQNLFGLVRNLCFAYSIYLSAHPEKSQEQVSVRQLHR